MSSHLVLATLKKKNVDSQQKCVEQECLFSLWATAKQVSSYG